MGVEKIGLDNDLSFGIEIELARFNINKLFDLVDSFTTGCSFDNKNWKAKSDVSVPLGGEIVSPILYDDVNVWRDIRSLTNRLDKEDLEISHRCGFHVHFNADYFESGNDKWTDLLTLILVYEPIIYRMGFNKKIMGRDDILEHAKPLNLVPNYQQFVEWYKDSGKNLFEGREIYSDFYKENIPDKSNSESFMRRTFGFNLSNVMYDKNKLTDYQILEREFKKTVEFRNADITYKASEMKTLIGFYGKLLMKSKHGLVDIELLNNKKQIYERSVDYGDFSNYRKVNRVMAEDLISLISDNSNEEEVYMRQYLKEKK